MSKHAQLAHATFIAHNQHANQELTVQIQSSNPDDAFLDDIALARDAFLPSYGYDVEPTAFHYKTGDGQVIIHAITDDNLGLLVDYKFSSHDKRVQFLEALKDIPICVSAKYCPADNDYVEIDLSDETNDILGAYGQIVLLCTQ